MTKAHKKANAAIGFRKPTYFAGFGALRFLAASLVIFHHIAQYKFWAGVPNDWGSAVVNAAGHLPVAFFFVLSGFLITYLLLKESENGKIDVLSFYWRRVIRIWPLYFLIAALSLALFGFFVTHGFEQLEAHRPGIFVVFSLLLILPNILRVSFPQLIGGNQLWSIGVEEQFYLFWPLLVGLFKRSMLVFLLGFVLIKFSLHIFLLGIMQLTTVNWLASFVKLFEIFAIEQMAIGGLGAVFIYQGHAKILSLLTHRATLVLAFSTLFLAVYWDWHFIGHTYLQALVFIVLLLQVVFNPAWQKFLETPLLVHLGSISYGIYMWHTLVIAMLIFASNALGLQNLNAVLYIFALPLTWVVAHISYVYLERPIMKHRQMPDMKMYFKTVWKRHESLTP